MKVICAYCKKIMFECRDREEYYRILEGQNHIQCQYCDKFMAVKLED